MLPWTKTRDDEVARDSDDARLLNARLTKAETQTQQLQALLFEAPIAILTCDANFTIDFVNREFNRTLHNLQPPLPIRPDQIIGSTLDRIIKDTTILQKVKNSKNLPLAFRLDSGESSLCLSIDGIRDNQEKITGYSITIDANQELQKVKNIIKWDEKILDTLPINILICDSKSFKVSHMNKTSYKTFKTLEHVLPIQIDNIVGTSIDQLYKDPNLQRSTLSDPKRLPHVATIQLGDEYVELHIAALYDEKNEYAAALLTWSVVTDQIKILREVKEIGNKIRGQASSVGEIANTMAGSIEKTSLQASAVAAASEQASVNVSTVANAAKELANSIHEISSQVEQLASVARQAANEADVADKTMHELTNAAQEINDVVKVIGDISAQIKLLALNATIEAARAGEAGRGFAVVATEVTNMVDQTSKATQEISAQITAIQRATQSAVNAIQKIVHTAEQVSEASTAIAAAVEEQGVVTQEISQNVAEAAIGTRDVSSNISGVTQTATESSRTAQTMLNTAGVLGTQANDLAALSADIEAFMKQKSR